MVSEVISALFSAKDEITPTLQKIQQSTRGVDQQMGQFRRELRDVASNSQGLDVNLQNLDRTARRAAQSANAGDRSFAEFDRTLSEVQAGTISADEGFNRMQRTLREMNTTTKETDRMVASVGRELTELAGQANMSGQALNRVNRSFVTTARNSVVASEGVNRLRRSTTRAALSKTALAAATDRVNRRLATTIPTAAGASQKLGLLAAVAAQTSFEMSSLSINIGPFNLALKNLLLQLPAILVGLGSAVAVVAALAAAFITAAAAMGFFMAGGLIMFLQDLGEQFDEAGQALEVFGAALRDLFVEALQPVMTDANVDLFIASVERAADIVNRFAQFFEIMRDDILGFFAAIEGDLDDLFTALRRVFLAMSPILIRFINFLINRLPEALEFFAERTEVLLESLAMLGDGFRNLFNQLLVFAGVVINAVAPVLAGVVEVLGRFFGFINRLNDSIVTVTSQFIALSLVGWKLHSLVTTVTGGFAKLTGVMRTQAAQSGALARMWTSAVGVAQSVIAGNITLTQAYTALTAALSRHTTTLAGNIHVRLQELPIIGKKAAAIWKMIFALATESAVRQEAIKSIKAHRLATIAGWKAVLTSIPAYLASAAALVAKGAAAIAAAGSVMVLHAVTGGLTKVIALAAVAVVSLAVLLWELVKAVRNGSSALSGVKSVLMFIADVIIGIVVPIINLLISVFNLLAAPMRGIINGFRAMADAIGGSSDEGDDGVSTFSQLADILIQVVDVLGLLTNVIAIVIEVIADLLESGIILFFQTIGRLIGWVIDQVRRMIDWLVDAISPFESAGEAGVAAFDLISRALDQVLGLLDSFISMVNAIPGVDIDAPSFDAGEVRQTLRAEEEEDLDEDEIETESEVNLSFEDAIEQNIEVDADPEDREQMRRTVKDAMNEANALQRRRE